MSSSVRIVASLIAGLMVGIALAGVDNAALTTVADALGLVGELWLNALRMTVLPLLVGLLITGVASTRETAASGRLAGRALTLFALVVTATATLSALLTPAMLALWPVDPGSRAALLAGLQVRPEAVPIHPPLREWFVGILPTNPFQAAAEGAVLPLVVFALIFGLAASRLEVATRAPLLGFFQAVVDAMLVVVRWVLWVAPLGVFALALGVGLHGGVAAAGALTQYLVMVCALAIVVTLAMIPLAAAFGGVTPRRFAAAIAPAQALAFSTQSSLACLPAMVTAARKLDISPRVAGVVLPLAVSVFKATSPPLNLAVVLFVAHVTGVELDPWRIALGVGVAVLTSFGVAGIPGQASFLTTTVPISAVMGVPVELLLLLLAVEVIPDIFRTVGNVTADVAVTAVIARRERGAGEDGEFAEKSRAA
jgi:proton glutamate symport protein